MSLKTYHQKRNFQKTSEPKGEVRKKKKTQKAANPIFVVQKHQASHLHYDFRLEMEGVLKSWAVPKGPSLNPTEKRLAIQVEDHPLDYADFEGSIPEGEYGGGDVIVWDQGKWIPPANLKEQFEQGKIEFTLKGKKLKGQWLLIKSKKSHYAKGKEAWLLIKSSDQYSVEEKGEDYLQEHPESVLSGKTLIDRSKMN